MLLGMGLFQWMNALWTKLAFPPAAGEYLIDVNGVTITLGSTVKLVGTVVSLDAVAPHFDGVGIKLLHPTGTGSIVGETFFVDPAQVVVGA